MAKFVIGVVGETGAGKTTFIRTLASQDRQDNPYIDQENELEHQLHSTVFPHIIPLSQRNIILIDTPGKFDFSGQLERSLAVLDYAIFILPANKMVSGESGRIWYLLRHYQVPTFVFVNGRTDTDLITNLSSACYSFAKGLTKDLLEKIALEDEQCLEEYLKTQTISNDKITSLIIQQKIFPCYFGSVESAQDFNALLATITKWGVPQQKVGESPVQVLRVLCPSEENIYSWVRVLHGPLKVKTMIGEQKVNQIQVLKNKQLQTVKEIKEGEICLISSQSVLPSNTQTVLSPSLNYDVIPQSKSFGDCLAALQILEKEEPSLSVNVIPAKEELQIQLFDQLGGMVLKELLRTRFGITIELKAAQISYRETITKTVEGIGHYSPLRHYSEVHLLMSPGNRGSGITFESQCPTNVLPANWQQVIKNELVSLNLPGVLIGAPITDIHCVLVGGIANLAHSGSEDFRKSTRRALRQGLMTLKKQGGCQILEPLDNFKLTIPEENLGQAMGDLQRMNGEVKSTININGMLRLTGVVPTNEIQNYSKQLRTYTHSQGYLECQTIGYQPSHQQTALITASHYDPTADNHYPANSLFCINKVNTEINWEDVPQFSYYPAGKLAK